MKQMSRILIIDDDELDRKAIVRKLKRAGFDIQCVEAANSEDSLNALADDEFNAILLDFRLAGETGLDVLKTFNSHGLVHIPIIMLSGMDDETLIAECLENGAQDYLLKDEINAKMLARSIRYAQERLRLLEEVTALAKYDPLTKLANRSQFTERLDNALSRAQRRDDILAVMYIDLDHFKNVNDTLGHSAGDDLLKSVAKRIKMAVRKSDMVARLGGDEFAVIVENVKEPKNAVPIAEKILSLLSTPHKIDDHEIVVSPSIGIAVYPDCKGGVETLLQSADTAMYHAKKQGRNNYQFFEFEMHKAVCERLVIENGLRHAIVNDELELHYQPQIDLSTQQIVAMEALLRWDHHQLGKISPDTFIPIAEETGIIQSIGDWVCYSACLQNKLWRRQYQTNPPIKMSINVSLVQLKNAHFYDDFSQLIQASGLDPRHLIVEMTESVMTDDPDATIVVLRKLHDFGVEIALDDFGTGYSSLSYLRKMPIDILKIDRCFIDRIGHNQKDEAIVKTIISMARNLDLEVIAEGVETQLQADFLKHNQCNIVQGYHYSKPLPMDLAAQYISSFMPQSTARTGNVCT